MNKKEELVKETMSLLSTKQNLTEMARIGFTDDGFEVYVNTDDGGNIPHFHYRTKGTWEFHSCIKIEKAQYFEHEGKESKLNTKQKKQLVKFLNGIDKEDNRTYWETIISEWNRNNSDKKVPKDLKMPNYLNLK